MTTATASTFEDLLACPRCGKSLSTVPTLRCQPCNVAFPELDGVPFLFSEPAAALADWRARLHRLLRQWESDAARTSRALKQKQLHPLTRERLEKLAAAQTSHVAELTALMEPLTLNA